MAKLNDFHDYVQDAKRRLGYNVRAITHDVIERAFPATVEAALDEGCDKMLVVGVAQAVTKQLKKPGKDTRQIVMADIVTELHPFVEAMGSLVFKVADAETDANMVDVREMLADDDLFGRACDYQEQVTRANAEVLTAMRDCRFANRALKDRLAKEAAEKLAVEPAA